MGSRLTPAPSQGPEHPASPGLWGGDNKSLGGQSDSQGTGPKTGEEAAVCSSYGPRAGEAPLNHMGPVRVPSTQVPLSPGILGTEYKPQRCPLQRVWLLVGLPVLCCLTCQLSITLCKQVSANKCLETSVWG